MKVAASLFMARNLSLFKNMWAACASGSMCHRQHYARSADAARKLNVLGDGRAWHE